MKRSTTRILTTHAGSLPRPSDLIAINQARLSGQPYDEAERAQRLRQAVANVVRAQREAGIQVLNDGEFGKATRGAVDYGAWGSYVFERLSGFELPGPDAAWAPGPGAFRFAPLRREEQAFDEFYSETRGQQGNTIVQRPVCVGPIRYQGQAAARWTAGSCWSGARSWGAGARRPGMLD